MVKYLLFALFRGFLKAIDIISQQCRINTKRTSKLSNVNLFMGQEKALQGRRFCILINKTLKTDVLIQISPMYSI